MRPVDFPQATNTLGRPAEMTDMQCQPLRVCVTSDSDGFGMMISCWRLAWRERLAVLFRGRVWLRVLGSSHPPVLVEAETPFKKEP